MHFILLRKAGVALLVSQTSILGNKLGALLNEKLHINSFKLLRFSNKRMAVLHLCSLPSSYLPVLCSHLYSHYQLLDYSCCDNKSKSLQMQQSHARTIEIFYTSIKCYCYKELNRDAWRRCLISMEKQHQYVHHPTHCHIC